METSADEITTNNYVLYRETLKMNYINMKYRIYIKFNKLARSFLFWEKLENTKQCNVMAIIIIYSKTPITQKYYTSQGMVRAGNEM